MAAVPIRVQSDEQAARAQGLEEAAAAEVGGETTAEGVVALLRRAAALEQLEMPAALFGGAVAEAAAAHPALARLRLSGYGGLDAAGMAALAARPWPRLGVLEAPTDDEAAGGLDWPAAFPALRALRCTAGGDVRGPVLLAGLARHCPRLEVLDLAGAEACELGRDEVGALLAGCPRLRVLLLETADLTDETVGALAAPPPPPAAGGCSALEVLELTASARLTAAQVRALLAAHPRLGVLAYCALRDAAELEALRSEPPPPSLRQLWLLHPSDVAAKSLQAAWPGVEVGPGARAVQDYEFSEQPALRRAAWAL